MEIMKEKKKLVLVAGAVAASLLLTAGATLMYFSSHTDTATNVLTFGDVKGVEMWERGGQLIRDGDREHPVFPYDDYIDGKIGSKDEVWVTEPGKEAELRTQKDPWMGFEWTGFRSKAKAGSEVFVMPGDVLTKEPYLKNTGTTPVYVKMIASFTVKDAEDTESVVGKPVASEKLPGGLEGLFNNWVWNERNGEKDNWQQFDSNWQAGEPKLNEARDTLTVPLYYTENGVLKVLNGGGTNTSPVFKEIYIPIELASLQSFSPELKLTAYVVQAANVDGTGTFEEWDKLFPTPTPKIG